MGHAVGELCLLVGLEEKACVGQPRADHALIARDDVLRVGKAHVRNDQELVGELAGGVEQREILLILPHGQDQAFLRYAEKLGLEFPDVHGRQLDQSRDFVEQRRDVLFRSERSLERGGVLRELAADVVSALFEIGDDAAFMLEAGFIFVGTHQSNVLLALEAMAMSDAAGRQAERGNVEHLVAVQRDQRVGGADEFDGRGAVGELVAHHLRNGQLGDGLLDRFG